MGLVDRLLEGDRRAAARAIRLVEDEYPEGKEILKRIYPYTGRAYILGITGPPGAGKSTMISRLVSHLRKRGYKVGVVAIDPTSPFSGGAILGDRIRMQDHSLDEGVFVKSLATRGHLGGLSKCTDDVIQVMDAMGMDIIIVETVGVGQDEVDIVKTADTTIVVMVPGLGDDIQAIKAGILEIADIFVVNKGDKPEADKTVRELKVMIDMSEPKDEGWKPPVFKVSAMKDEGFSELINGIFEHRKFLEKTGRFESYRRDRLENLFVLMLKDKLIDDLLRRMEEKGLYKKLISEMFEKRIDPYTVLEKIQCECMYDGEKI